ncbi:MAG: hypothetical protein ABI690_36690 [Chloroflexota bacterium]
MNYIAYIFSLIVCTIGGVVGQFAMRRFLERRYDIKITDHGRFWTIKGSITSVQRFLCHTLQFLGIFAGGAIGFAVGLVVSSALNMKLF